MCKEYGQNDSQSMVKKQCTKSMDKVTINSKETVYKEYGQSDCQSMVKRLCVKSMGKVTDTLGVNIGCIS